MNEKLRSVDTSSEAVAPVRIIELAAKEVVPSAWDSFAQSCGASYFSAYDALALQLKDAVRLKRRFFDIRGLGPSGKIGQCAIAIGAKDRVFLDGIQLLPRYDALWGTTMGALLARLGPGRYRYGSEWSIEPRRQELLEAIPGVKLEAAKPVIVQAVDFTRWTSWEAYLRDVSDNAKRNAKRARFAYPDLSIQTHRQLSCLPDAMTVSRLRFDVASRKELGLSLPSILAGFVFRTAALRRYAMTAIARGRGKARAAISGIEFGDNTFYLTGGSTPQNDGAAWNLLLSMLHDSFERTGGRGKFIMGQVLDETSPGWENLARSRAQCRVSEFPTALLSFCYDLPHSA